MRELKVRAWDKTNKVMHLFDNHHVGRGFGTLLFQFDPPLVHLDTTTFLNEGAESHHEFMLYTGLKDKNGVDIYECDIVKSSLKGNRIVAWNEKALEYTTLGYVDIGLSHWIIHENTLEVIGNIYENPELVEQQDAN